MAKLKVLEMTPAALGYSFPAEWEAHAGTWFSWPRPEGISFPDKYHTVPENLARIIREITPREQVHINVPNGNYERIVKEQLKAGGCGLKNIFFHQIKTNESWCRDHGPAFVLKKGKKGDKAKAAIVDWGFNAWGGKYPPYDSDDAVPTRVAEEFKLPVFYPVDPRKKVKGEKTKDVLTEVSKPVPPCVIMEGGAVDFNGEGVVLTTEQCLLNKNRNPHLSRREVEQYLKDYFG